MEENEGNAAGEKWRRKGARGKSGQRKRVGEKKVGTDCTVLKIRFKSPGH